MVENIIEDDTIQCNKIKIKAFACVGTCTDDQGNITFSHQHISSPLDTNIVLLLKYICQCLYYLLLTFMPSLLCLNECQVSIAWSCAISDVLVVKNIGSFNTISMEAWKHQALANRPLQELVSLVHGPCLALAHSHRTHIINGITYWKRITWDL